MVPRTTLLLLLLCACTSRATDVGEGDGSTAGEDPMTSSTADESSGPSTVTTSTTSVTTATADGPVPSSFEGDVQPIFDEHCVEGCHEPDGEWGFLLDLTDSAYAAIVGVPAPQFSAMALVEPGDPSQSYLWHKLEDTQSSIGGAGLPMPKPRAGMQATVVTPEQRAAIEQWILQGAPP